MSVNRVLVTGAGGFVGKHLITALRRCQIEVIAHYRHHSEISSGSDVQATWFDLSDIDVMRTVLSKTHPDAIIHLAALSSVSQSWEIPEQTIQTNLVGTVTLLTSVRDILPHCRVLTVGSGEEYGFNEGSVPLNESVPCNPSNPYALSKYSVGLLARQFHDAYGVQVVHVRPFNHIGPGQRKGFVLPDFAKRLTYYSKLGHAKAKIEVGNLDVIRDFTDVRDVVDAYIKLVRFGKPGDVYNVCSGTGISLSQLLFRMAEFLKLDMDVTRTESLTRKIDIPVLIGDPTKIMTQLNWRPTIHIDDTLRDIISETLLI